MKVYILLPGSISENCSLSRFSTNMLTVYLKEIKKHEQELGGKQQTKDRVDKCISALKYKLIDVGEDSDSHSL